MHSLRLLSSLTVLAATLACAGDSPFPTEPGVLLTARQPSNPGVIWEFYDQLSDATTPAKITGDGTGAYQSGVCGVRGEIFVSGGIDSDGNPSGDATFDPDADYKRNFSCPRRYLNFTLESSKVQIGPFTNARGVSHMEPNTKKLETMGWGVSLPNCERLVFGETSAGDNRVTITREPNDALGRRTWVVETNSPHTGECRVWSAGSYVPSGVTHYLPYRARVTEVL